MPGLTNPFYKPASSSADPASSQPSSSAPPTDQPAQYKSLADLTRNQPKLPPRGKQEFTYTPDASRQGYNTQSTWGTENLNTVGGNKGDGRKLPPAPGNYGKGIPGEPPRRDVAPTLTSPTSGQPATGPASYLPASAQGYANSASSYANAGVGKAKDGFDSMFTQERKDQVASGLGKAAAGGAKLLGKATWQLGKFAANPTGK